MPVKDSESSHPVASRWRPTFREIVTKLVRGDFTVANVPSVTLRTSDTSEQMAKYVAAYGETLVELPDETWMTSECVWLSEHWDVFVDLWTAESGRSDMVLKVAVREVESGFAFEIHLLYVP